MGTLEWAIKEYREQEVEVAKDSKRRLSQEVWDEVVPRVKVDCMVDVGITTLKSKGFLDDTYELPRPTKGGFTPQHYKSHEHHDRECFFAALSFVLFDAEQEASCTPEWNEKFKRQRGVFSEKIRHNNGHLNFDQWLEGKRHCKSSFEASPHTQEVAKIARAFMKAEKCRKGIRKARAFSLLAYAAWNSREPLEKFRALVEGKLPEEDKKWLPVKNLTECCRG